jgi:hypothetical protein
MVVYGGEMQLGSKLLVTVVVLQLANTAMLAGIFWIFWIGGW